MKKHTFKITLLLSLLSFSKYQSQSNISDKQIYNVATPEVANLMRYADFPESDFIGKSNISVPIYNISFGKLNFPIGLAYNTKGNKASDIATNVGLGWNLNAAGNLTVKVNDMNDLIETYAYYTTAGFEPERSFAWHRQSKGYLSTEWPKALEDTQDFTSQLCINHRIWENDDRLIDSAPDFYYVNAPGFNDRFYFTRNDNNQLKANFFTSNAKLNNNINLKIKRACGSFESTGFGNSGAATVFYQPDKFEIVGDNGYLYTFNDYEYSNIKDYPLDLNSHTIQKVNNWYLTKVKDPYSGKEINFEYESFTNNYEHLSLITLFNYIGFGNYNASSLELKRPVRDPGPDRVFNKLLSSQFVGKRLKKIITDKETIDFNYDFQRLDYGGQALNNILVKNKNGNTIKQVNFNYSYFDSGNCSAGNYECKRLKLVRINDSSSGDYSFYYDNTAFPPRNTSKVDFLGYYNNNNSNITFSNNDFHPYDFHYYPNTKYYFYPDLSKDNILPFPLKNKTAHATSFEIDRTPSAVSKLGLLNKMVYPTGGALELDYENDDFMYEGEKYILGSTRVKMMRLYDSQNTISKEIKYKYINENNASSGQINFITSPEENTNSSIASGIGFNTDAVIGYSRIIEETTGKGYIEKKYSNFNDYPDKLMDIDQNITNQGHLNFIKYMKFPNSYIQSFDDRRGKLLSVNYYKENQATPIKKQEYSYDYKVRGSLKVTKRFFFDTNPNYEEYSASNNVLTYFNNVKSSTKQDFFSTGSIKEENIFNYDEARLISKKTIIGGDTSEEFYRNAKDKSTQKLINANILDIPVEIEKRENGKLLSKQETKYENPGNILPSSIVTSTLESNNTFTEITYDKYDSKNNLLQYTTKDGIPTTLIWGYNQSQPIAKITGADYSQIMQAFGLNTNDNNSYLSLDIVKKSDLHFDSTSESELISKLNDFRNKQEFKNYSISTYTHAPLIGVKSITESSGKRESYEYDNANRLEKIKDTENKTIKDFKYNYILKYYNSVKNQVFTRNNCGVGYLGGTYTYNIPYGTYSSIISQADADNQAQNDINSYGQNNANISGSCDPKTCMIQGIKTPGDIHSIFTSGIMATYLPGIFNVKVNFYHNGGTTKAQIVGDCSIPSIQTIKWGSWEIMVFPGGGMFISTRAFVTEPNGFVNLDFYVNAN